MTRFQAVFVRLIRTKHNYTYRDVSREWMSRYDAKIPFGSEDMMGSGVKEHGIELCEDAIKELGDEAGKHW